MSALSKEGCSELTYAAMDRLSDIAIDAEATRIKKAESTDGANA
jgi:hypothetical protein